MLFTLTLALAPLLPQQRPNIVVVLADDMGYSDIGCYGGEIETPRLDALASGGLRFTQFYNAARCCPTRASLLTGLYPHQAGIGHMTSEGVGQGDDKGHAGYRGTLSPETATIAEVLGDAGYRTYMSGKWHVGTFEGSWPLDRGFDRFSGMIRGASNFWQPSPDKLLMVEREPIEPPADFYATDAFTDYAVGYLHDAETADEEPFFLYLAYTAPHWPLHAHDEDVERYRGKYAGGWDELRAARHARMVELGLVDEDWALSERDAKAWDELSDEKRDELDWRMAIYAAQVDRMDRGVGRVVDALRELGELENTLILFLADNGGCAEGGELGGGPEDQLGTKQGYWLTYGRAWANASNTPFRRYKHWVHEGGIASPLIAHWPAGIEARGELRDEPGHLIDLMATCVDLAGAKYAETRRGAAVPPMEGTSLTPVFAGERLPDRKLFWEHEGNAAVRDGRWKLVARQGGDWELYDLERDRTETNDLAREKPGEARRMFADYESWAKRVGVLPFPVRRAPGYSPPERVYPKTWKDLANDGRVRFVVTAPDERGPLYLAGTFNGWQPGDPEWKLERDGARWSLRVERERLGRGPIELKLTRGSWATTEVRADLADVPNRVLREEDLGQELTFEVAAWADDRGADTAASTVTGRLDILDVKSERLDNTRKVRVWLPPDYDEPGSKTRRYPVLYLADGQNVFDSVGSFLGVEWEVDETLTKLIEAGTIEPLIVVGIDNAGPARKQEYNPPYTSSDGTPNRGDVYLDFVTKTVMPMIEQRYRVARGKPNTAIGGSSYGGNITLYAALRHPELFGALLIESPAAFAFDGALLDRCAKHEDWPERVFVGVGTRESENAFVRSGYKRTIDVLRKSFEKAGLDDDRVLIVVETGAEHTESAWARRLPGALEFLFGK